MKIVVRNLIGFFLIGLLVTCGIVFYYDGNLYHYDIVIQGAILFAIITFVLERLMMYIYIRLKLHSIVRILLTTLFGIGLYTLGVWLTRPYLLYKVFNAPVFALAILPMFLIFSIAFEILQVKKERELREKLNNLLK